MLQVTIKVKLISMIVSTNLENFVAKVTKLNNAMLNIKLISSVTN